ncbi:peptide chain release factor N(5)-glutamine methyltransferase [Alteribacillus iranensis]|uniref:Release factor glutamine methyltransferase n=1 Tax=Alteribacillus iranensis TaxID=930128 RepID=A0A1I2BZS3_9BACI|nr:peptide chain release factor N(5)-glutamine methyltransferase [Alteribacillus iranensis]SFE61617.1 release factor glutamine methyltransferase [Alteribacillus iranensis]
MKKPQRVYEALEWASSFLEKNGREPRAADLLLKHHLGLSWTDFYIERREPLPDRVWEHFYRHVLRHAEGVPIQHLLGYEEFYGRRFSVSDKVLIPRPETEELVAGVLNWLKGREHATVADIGTGSGIIAITLALEHPSLQVTATDISNEALQIAEKNAGQLGASVSFYQGDLLEPLRHQAKKWDVIVSNPPYIPKTEWLALDPLVKEHEPERALIGEDEDGLLSYRAMARDLPTLLKEDGLAAFEIGEKQGNDVKELFQSALPEANISIRRDLNGKERMVFCENKKQV